MVSSTVKVQKGGYSVASETKNTGSTVKVQKGGYSVAQEKGTTTYTSSPPLSVSSGPKSVAAQDAQRAAEQKKINESVASLAAQKAVETANYNARLATQQANIKANQAKIDAQIAAATKAQVVYPTIKVGSNIKSTAQTTPVVSTPQKTTTSKITSSQLGTLTEVKTSIPSVVSKSYATNYINKQVATPIKPTQPSTKNFGMALAAENKPIISSHTLKGSYSNVGYVPSVVNPANQKTYIDTQNTKKSIASLKGTGLEDIDTFNQLRSAPTQLYQDYSVGSTPIATLKQSIKEGNTLDRINTYWAKQYNDIYNKITNSQTIRIVDTAYKTSTGRVLPLGSIITPKFLSNAAVGTTEGVVTFVPSTLTMGKGLVTNPVGTIKEVATGTYDLARTNPGRLTGNIIGSTLVGGAISKTSAPIKGKIKNVVTEKVSIPSIQSSYVSFVETPGANAIYSRVKIGESIAVKGTPIYSSPTTMLKGATKAAYEKAVGKPVTGIVKGGLTASDDILKGRQMTAFGKLETTNFLNTVKRTSGDADYFIAGKSIADSVYNTKIPVYKATEFKISAKDIPESAWPYVEKSVKEYKGNIAVYGSESQKAQIREYMTRPPGDVEIKADNPIKYSKFLDKQLKKSGVPYEISAGKEPKVTFFTESGKPMKGIEIFEFDNKTGTTLKPTKTNIDGYVMEYYQHPSNIAYGYTPLDNIKVGGTGIFKRGSVKMLDVREQSARKFAGATTFKEGRIGLTHPGRIKDVRDLIDIGTGHAIEKNPLISSDIVTYTTKAVDKYPQLLDEPLVSFIDTKQRLPTKSEFNANIALQTNEVLAYQKKVSDIFALQSTKTFKSPMLMEFDINKMFSDFKASETANVNLLGGNDVYSSLYTTRTIQTSDIIDFKSFTDIKKTNTSPKITRTPYNIIAENIDYIKKNRIADYDKIFEKAYNDTGNYIKYPTFSPNIKKSTITPSFKITGEYPTIIRTPTFKIQNPTQSGKNIVYPSTGATFNNIPVIIPEYQKISSGNKKVGYPTIQASSTSNGGIYSYPIIEQPPKYPLPYPIINNPPAYPTPYPEYPQYPDYPTYPTTNILPPIRPTGRAGKEQSFLYPKDEIFLNLPKKKKTETVKKDIRNRRFQWFIQNPIADVFDEKEFRKLQNAK